MYSPTVIMQLENSERILQKHLPVMILLHVITNLILALLIILIIKAVRGIVVVTVTKVFGKEFPVRPDPDPLELPRAKKATECA